MSEKMTNAQFSALEARRNVDVLAYEITALAERLRQIAQRMEGNGKASTVAADIVNEYVQHGGKAGVRLQQLMTNVADADRAYRSNLHKEN